MLAINLQVSSPLNVVGNVNVLKNPQSRLIKCDFFGDICLSLSIEDRKMFYKRWSGTLWRIHNIIITGKYGEVK